MRPTGEWSAGISYGQQPLNEVYVGSFPNGTADSRRTFQQVLILSGEAGLSERFSLTGALPLRSVELSGDESVRATGAGDLQVGARQSLTDPERQGSRFAMVATYGAWLPTGKGNETEAIAENFSFTRGAVTLVGGGEVSFRLGARSRIFAQAEAQYPTGADRVVVDPNAGAQHYRFAPSRFASLNVTRSYMDGRLSWLAGASQAYAGADKLDGIPMMTRGGSVRRLVAGVLFAPARRQNVGLLINRLLRADMNGDRDPVLGPGEGQIIARTEIVVAWQGTFGEHRHPVGKD